MNSMLVSSAVDCGFKPWSVKPKTIKLVFVFSLLNMQHQGEKAHTGWLVIRKMCLCGAICLPLDCCFSELAL